MKKVGFWGLALAVLFFVPAVSSAAILYSQSIILSTGWNIVSTPKILDSHSFSATENSTNFDIYALDPSKTSGWATLADLGQTEFTPLYGYFINNKTGSAQTLTFNYLASTTPNQRLFERKFTTTGWYSIGVANPSYALGIEAATSTDSNNPNPILTALTNAYDTLIDLTDGGFTTNVRSVAVASSWKAGTPSTISSINDLRETKGYAVHILSANSLYNGFQNDTVSNDPNITLGSFSTTTSSFDPGGAQSKPINTNGVRVSGIRFIASSVEDLKLYSIRWRQVGTASASDLANVVTVAGSTSYPTTVSADGKYYTSTFSGGILLAKGNAIDVYTKVDIVGSNSASRTIDLDIDRATDLDFVGQTYGQGITDTVAPNAQPWFNGYVTTIASSTVNDINKASEVPAQNIAVNVQNQILGGFYTNFTGEAVSVTSLPITIATSTSFGGPITSISLVDSNGVVVAGPVDEASTCTTGCTVTFTDTVTFPVGRKVYTVKGKIPSGAPNNATVIVSTNPSAWNGVTGQTSGNTITITQSTFAMNTMTIKAATLTAAMSTSPASQNVVAGTQSLLMGNVQLDASTSGEDVRMSSIKLTQTGTITNLSSCQLYNGSTALNTGSNVPSSLATSGSDTTFTFDNSLTIPKDTVVTLAIKCNLGSGTSGTHVWSISGTALTATGVTTGTSIDVTETAGNSGTMTITSASLAVVVDSSSPSYTLAASGTTGQTMGVLKLRASNEAITLTKLGLTLTSSGNTRSNAAGGSTNNGVSDLVQIYIYDGSTLVGTATFTGSNTTATSTLSTAVTLPKDTDKLLTIKADLASIGTGQAGGVGDVIKVDPLNVEGSGQSSGTTVKSGATGGVAGIRLFKSYPTLALDTLSSTGVADGRLMRFKVTANAANPVSIFHFEFKISTTTGVTVTNIQLFGYTDSSYSSAISGQGTGGQVGGNIDSILTGTAFTIEPNSVAVQVPSGTTRYFELRATVTGVDTGDSIVTTLLGDAAYPTNITLGYNVSTSTAATSTNEGNFNFVWSGNSTTTSSHLDTDWSNGFGLPGLPSGGLNQTRSN